MAERPRTDAVPDCRERQKNVRSQPNRRTMAAAARSSLSAGRCACPTEPGPDLPVRRRQSDVDARAPAIGLAAIGRSRWRHGRVRQSLARFASAACRYLILALITTTNGSRRIPAGAYLASRPDRGGAQGGRNRSARATAGRAERVRRARLVPNRPAGRYHSRRRWRPSRRRCGRPGHDQGQSARGRRADHWRPRRGGCRARPLGDQ